MEKVEMSVADHFMIATKSLKPYKSIESNFKVRDEKNKLKFLIQNLSGKTIIKRDERQM